jgi:hypothetical protein
VGVDDVGEGGRHHIDRVGPQVHHVAQQHQLAHGIGLVDHPAQEALEVGLVEVGLEPRARARRAQVHVADGHDVALGSLQLHPGIFAGNGRLERMLTYQVGFSSATRTRHC